MAGESNGRAVDTMECHDSPALISRVTIDKLSSG